MNKPSFSSWPPLLACCLAPLASAQQAQPEVHHYRTETNILYRVEGDITGYMRDRCRLDVYYPAGATGFTAVVWFHGGGLTSGERFVPEGLKEKGIAVVAAGYRLSPRAKSPAYIEDAAAAVAWTFRHIAEYGGATNRIFVSGHSAGGYLTSMVGLDKRWLRACGLDADRIAGLVPLSGQAITHFTIRSERGIDAKQPIVDDMAPLYHVRKDAPPLLLITGDRDLELLGRYEENAYLWRMMKLVGHTRTQLFELGGFNHGQMPEPAYPLLLRFVRQPPAAPASGSAGTSDDANLTANMTPAPFSRDRVFDGAAEPSATTPAPVPHRFSFGGPDNSEFLLDGQPFQIRSGEMHPDRIPPEYWRHRLQMAKAMGLNTVAIYVFWNAHEPEEGRYDFTSPPRDIGEFLRIAREAGVWVLLRPGPYCCGEWDFGGIPTYLLRYPDLKLRTLADAHYAKAAENYLRELAKVVRPHLAENGGPILMLQIENEYGSYPRRDHDYLVWLRDLWVKAGVRGPFYTSDGASEGFLKGVTLPGAAVGLDTGENESHWAVARKMNPGVPVFSSETYPGWLRHWGEGNWSASDVSGLVAFYMEKKKSFNLYMLHGGSNFGFTAGANNGGAGYEPDVTSYDYGSPIDEQGRATPAYHALRKQLASSLPPGETLPDIPSPIPAMAIPEISLRRWSGLWEQLPAPKAAEAPACFESIGQNQGMMLYRTRIAAGEKRKLSFANLHDYGQVFVDGSLIGTLDRRLGQREVELPACGKEATLEILVEAMGHINFTIGMDSDRKGIYGEVKLGGVALSGWEMFPLPLADDWAMNLSKTTSAAARPGGIFKGRFSLDRVADTFLDLSKWKKGVVWVNGHNLGRFWSIGPQQRLYCPAPWLKAGANDVVVLDLWLTEPQALDGKERRN